MSARIQDHLTPPVACTNGCGAVPMSTAWFVQDGWLCADCRALLRERERTARRDRVRQRDLLHQRRGAGLCWNMDDAA